MYQRYPQALRRFQYALRAFLPQHRTTSIEQQCRNIHLSAFCEKKAKADISSEPYRFTTHPASSPTLPVASKDVNPYQSAIVLVSLLVFGVYFLYLREENDLDDMLNTPLFERVPQVEEPHLRQAIPLMRAKGEDTREAEARLKELIQERLEKEKQEKSSSL